MKSIFSSFRHNRRKMRNALMFAIGVVLLTITLIWILNIIGIISGAWSVIFSALLTVASIVFALLQYRRSSTENPTYGVIPPAQQPTKRVDRPGDAS